MSNFSGRQGGVVILESLVAIFLFSVGLLGLVAMYANSMTQTSDAQYRAEAMNYANQMMNEIWIRADRRTGGRADNASITPFAYNQVTNSFTANACNFSGGGANPVTTDWVARVTGTGATPNPYRLPGASVNQVQVLVGNAASMNQVTISICWQTPQDAAALPLPIVRNYVLVGNVI